jgi:hypothetical protein
MPDTKSKFLEFKLVGESSSGKTLIWDVLNTGYNWLGRVTWFPQWRKYTFETVSMTVLDPICLRDIADFCEAATEEHRSKANNKKGSAVTS